MAKTTAVVSPNLMFLHKVVFAVISLPYSCFFSRDIVLTISYTFVFTLGADLLNVVYPFVENLGFTVILFSIFLVTHANIIALK